jgi:SAM-dependent methyltransferase
VPDLLLEHGCARPLHWGCGDVRPSGWINADIRGGPGIDIIGDIVEDGLALPTDSTPYIVSQHALQQLGIYDVLRALQELHRVLAPGGVLRLGLPDLDQAIDACRRGDRNYFWCWDWDSISGNMITQIIDYNATRTPLTCEFTEELLRRAGFEQVVRTTYRETSGPFPGITDLDGRPEESFFVEAFKGRAAARPRPTFRVGRTRSTCPGCKSRARP